jgi:hypothetical protein
MKAATHPAGQLRTPLPELWDRDLHDAWTDDDAWDQDSWDNEAWIELRSDEADIEQVKASMPAFLAEDADWVETYAAGATLQDAVRWVLGPEGEALTDDEVDTIVESAIAGMTPEQAENFFKSIGKAFKSVAPVLAKALPVVGGVVGSIVPGVGTALGTALGGVAGGLLSQATKGGAPARTVSRAVQRAVPRQFGHMAQGIGQVAQVGAGAARTLAGAGIGAAHQLAGAGMGAAGQIAGGVQGAAGQLARGGTSAVNQLMSLINNPQFLGSLANAAMGGRGQTSGGGSFGGFMNALSGLAQEAQAEVYMGIAAENLGRAGESVADEGDRARQLVQIIGEATQNRGRS